MNKQDQQKEKEIEKKKALINQYIKIYTNEIRGYIPIIRQYIETKKRTGRQVRGSEEIIKLYNARKRKIQELKKIYDSLTPPISSKPPIPLDPVNYPEVPTHDISKNPILKLNHQISDNVPTQEELDELFEEIDAITTTTNQDPNSDIKAAAATIQDSNSDSDTKAAAATIQDSNSEFEKLDCITQNLFPSRVGIVSSTNPNNCYINVIFQMLFQMCEFKNGIIFPPSHLFKNSVMNEVKQILLKYQYYYNTGKYEVLTLENTELTAIKKDIYDFEKDDTRAEDPYTFFSQSSQENLVASDGIAIETIFNNPHLDDRFIFKLNYSSITPTRIQELIEAPINSAKFDLGVLNPKYTQKYILLYLPRLDKPLVNPDPVIQINGLFFKLKGIIVFLPPESGPVSDGHYVYVTYNDKGHISFIYNNQIVIENIEPRLDDSYRDPKDNRVTLFGIDRIEQDNLRLYTKLLVNNNIGDEPLDYSLDPNYEKLIAQNGYIFLYEINSEPIFDPFAGTGVGLGAAAVKASGPTFIPPASKKAGIRSSKSSIFSIPSSVQRELEALSLENIKPVSIPRLKSSKSSSSSDSTKSNKRPDLVPESESESDAKPKSDATPGAKSDADAKPDAKPDAKSELDESELGSGFAPGFEDEFESIRSSLLSINSRLIIPPRDNQDALSQASSRAKSKEISRPGSDAGSGSDAGPGSDAGSDALTAALSLASRRSSVAASVAASRRSVPPLIAASRSESESESIPGTPASGLGLGLGLGLGSGSRPPSIPGTPLASISGSRSGPPPGPPISGPPGPPPASSSASSSLSSLSSAITGVAAVPITKPEFEFAIKIIRKLFDIKQNEEIKKKTVKTNHESLKKKIDNYTTNDKDTLDYIINQTYNFYNEIPKTFLGKIKKYEEINTNTKIKLKIIYDLFVDEYKFLNFINSNIILKPSINNVTRRQTAGLLCNQISELIGPIRANKTIPSQIPNLTKRNVTKRVVKEEKKQKIADKAKATADKAKAAADKVKAKQTKEQIEAAEKDIKKLKIQELLDKIEELSQEITNLKADLATTPPLRLLTDIRKDLIQKQEELIKAKKQLEIEEQSDKKGGKNTRKVIQLANKTKQNKKNKKTRRSNK